MRIEDVTAFIERLEARQKDTQYFEKVDACFASTEREFLHEEIDKLALNELYSYVINIYKSKNLSFFENNIDAYRGLHFRSTSTGLKYDFQIAIDEESKYALIVAAKFADWRLDSDKPQEFLKTLYHVNNDFERNTVRSIVILSLLEGPQPKIKSIYRSFLGAEYVTNEGKKVYTVYSPMRNATLADLSYRWELATFPTDIYNILHDILLAVKFYHDRGYVHQAIKSDNIYISFSDDKIQPELGWFGRNLFDLPSRAEDMLQLGVLYFEMLYQRQPNHNDAELIASDKLLSGLLSQRVEDRLNVDSALQLLNEVILNEQQLERKHKDEHEDTKLYEIYRAELMQTPPTTPCKKRKGESHVFRC